VASKLKAYNFFDRKRISWKKTSIVVTCFKVIGAYMFVYVTCFLKNGRKKSRYVVFQCEWKCAHLFLEKWAIVSGIRHMGQFQRFEENFLMKMCSPISVHMSYGKRYSTHGTVPEVWRKVSNENVLTYFWTYEWW
jgi:hypothetical protein